MRTLILPQLIILLLAVTCALADCPITRAPRNTQIGEFTAQIFGHDDGDLQYSFPLIEDLQDVTNLRTSLSIPSLHLTKQSPFLYIFTSTTPTPTSLTFTITTTPAPSASPRTSASSPKNIWTSIRIQFLTSKIPELLVDSFEVLTYQDVGKREGGRVKRVSAEVVLGEIQFNFGVGGAVGFVSGVYMLEDLGENKKNNVTDMRAKLERSNWNPNIIAPHQSLSLSTPTLSHSSSSSKSTISMDLTTINCVVKKLRISYVIFLKRNIDNVYQIATGNIFIQHSGIFAIDTFGLGQAGFIYGISSLSFQSSQSTPITLSYNISPSFSTSPTVSASNQNLSIQVSFLAIEHIPGSACKTCPMSPIHYDQFCVSVCPAQNHVVVGGIDGELMCQPCDVEKFFGRGKVGESCVCLEGFYFISPTESCHPCPPTCTSCLGQSCLSCPTNSHRILDSLTKSCICPSQTKQGLSLYDNINNNQVVCVVCHYTCATCLGPQWNQCSSCKMGRVFVDGGCQCAQGAGGDGCLGRVGQGVGQVVGQGVREVVRQGVVCGEGEKIGVVGGKVACVCAQGYFQHLLTNKCTRTCPPPKQYSYNTESCACPPDTPLDPKSQKCMPCRLNQYLDPLTNKCQCISGYQMNTKNQCIQCPPKMYYNQDRQSCQCIFNYIKQGQQCIRCSQGIIGCNWTI